MDKTDISTIQEVGKTEYHRKAECGDRTLLNKPEVWNIKDAFGIPVAHYMADNGLIVFSRDFFTVRDNLGNTTAHFLAYRGKMFFIDIFPDLLSEKNNYGISVKEVLTLKGLMESNPKEKTLSTIKDTGRVYCPVFNKIRKMVAEGRFDRARYKQMKKEIVKSPKALNYLAGLKFFKEKLDKDVLSLSINESKVRVAHVQAYNGYFFRSEEILKLEDNCGWTVAHIQAEMGDKAIVRSPVSKVPSSNGITPLHLLVFNGKIEEEEVLTEKDLFGIPYWFYSPYWNIYFRKETTDKIKRYIKVAETLPFYVRTLEPIKIFMKNTGIKGALLFNYSI